MEDSRDRNELKSWEADPLEMNPTLCLRCLQCVIKSERSSFADPNACVVRRVCSSSKFEVALDLMAILLREMTRFLEAQGEQFQGNSRIYKGSYE